MASDNDKSRLVELLRGAIALTSSERDAFLDRECPDDPRLRAEVERLLANEAAARAFLPTSLEDTTGVGQAPPFTDDAMERIGPYLILRPLGEGGMGSVYLAEQREPVRRHVALKLIKRGMDTREVIARFEAERQALALMSHPAIAQVYDAGETEDGRPFFVMEHVEGIPITDYCDLHRLSIRERLELIAEVCRGVHHAHGKGVIHRDIKPSNVLVCRPDVTPIPKIIDFGVAKAMNRRLTEKTLYSELGRVIGTPAYMSPEQAEGAERIDQRTDVYSLGVLLYEVLVGELPLELTGAAFYETIRLICQEDPPTPSTRWSRLNDERTSQLASRRNATPSAYRRSLKQDLDWITMKALEKEPRRRYFTAAELADQIDLYLADKPVTAGPPSVLYRARKFARKNRGPVTAAAAVFLALSVGLVVSANLAARLHRQLDEVLRLADVKRLADYEHEAKELWPASSRNVRRLEDWIGRADALASRLDRHREDLAALEKSLPREDADSTAEEGTPQGEAARPAPPRRLVDDEAAWRCATLAQLVNDLEVFTAPDSGTLADVRERLEFARTVRQRTVEGEEVRAKWKEAIKQIGNVETCPAYNGLELEPREGLIPLGRDPDSGLWEFAHLQTGRPAERGADGRLEIKEETGLVLVLIPGGTYRIGAVPPVGDRKPGSPHVDPQATMVEVPDHDVELAPFFISKYEMTQAQWLRFTSENPSWYAKSKPTGEIMYTLLHPIEMITWETTSETLPRLGLTLPTEAQWEAAARGGTSTIWWTGDDVESLEGAANIADRTYKARRGPGKDVYSPEIDDGYFAHAPIGTFPRANAFGLYDVVGNVWEWCRDSFGGYINKPRGGDGLRAPSNAPGHAYRGGGYNLPAQYARSATRFNGEPGFRFSGVGVRPAMELKNAGDR